MISRARCTGATAKARTAHRGVALLSVLWIAALLTVAAGGLSQEARTDTQLARNLVEAAQARHAAAGAVELMALRLQEIARDPQMLAAPQSMRVGDVEVQVRVSDEAGKIDLNAAPLELLQELLGTAGLEETRAAELAAAVLDWRDADDLRMLNGAEDAEYRAAGKAYGAKDARFGSVEEVQLVLGMTPALYARIRPALTVHSRQTGINPVVASALVLEALPETSAEEVVQYLDERAQAGPSTPPRFGAARRYLTAARGRAYTVDARAETPAGAVAHLSATLRLGRGTGGLAYRVVSWEIEPPGLSGVFAAPSGVPREEAS